MAILLLSLSPHPPNPPQNPNPTTPKPTISLPTSTPASSKRNLILKTTSLFLISLTPQQYPVAHSSPQAPPPPPRPALSGISNTKNWFQFFGDGFAIRVPPQFQDVQEPEAKDITDLGSLKEAAKIFIPVGSTVYSARAIRIKEEEGFRTYYFYEFGVQEQHAALVAAVNGGKTYIAGATAPQSKWNDDGVKLRSAAISMTVL
ncbi:uncharacterized protein LOC126619080 isoform X3 [Malus sylvestris]|uniref:uncharacterized protein LOC126619080 isoform X3 n=1 Tax=Malus sylvestris TaxID=3752 RepID=UPI0010AACF67|nr:uncharacterized protein LOC103433980 isoform X3 [Malus domestica]XP_050143304.1 uncharacterized protein LOC126619080 isoform X3 [Malus sylvestris]